MPARNSSSMNYTTGKEFCLCWILTGSFKQPLAAARHNIHWHDWLWFGELHIELAHGQRWRDGTDSISIIPFSHTNIIYKLTVQPFVWYRVDKTDAVARQPNEPSPNSRSLLKCSPEKAEKQFVWKSPHSTARFIVRPHYQCCTLKKQAF